MHGPRGSMEAKAKRLHRAREGLKDFCETLYPSHDDEGANPLFMAIQEFVEATVAVMRPQ